MNSKSTIVRAILMDASECERPEAEHPATIEISAEDLQRILERHFTAAPQATPFMWAIQEPGGGAYMDDGCVSSVREDVQAEVDGLNSGLDADDDPYQVVPVYLAAAPQAVQAAVPEGWKLAPIKVPDSAFAWVSGGYPAGFKAGDKRDTAVVHERAQRTWEAILDGITAPAHPAEGVPAQPGKPLRDLALGVTSFLDHAGMDTSRLPAGMGAALRRLRDAAIATQPATQGVDAEYRRGYQDGYNRRDAEVKGALA